MNEQLIQQAFSPERAEFYDEQFIALGAIKDSMHLFVQVRFAELPADARILVAGAGTGAEVRFLAPRFPRWRFTLVDPADGMLAVARRHAEAEGFVDRCTFHHGYVSDSPREPHDAATSILVSHFLTDAGARRDFFRDIAARLKPGGLLFNADLAADRDAKSFEHAMDLWLLMMAYAQRGGEARRFIATDADPEAGDDAPGPPSYREMFGRDFAAHGPAEVEALIASAGFRDLVFCYQAGLIRSWFARRE